MAVNLHHADTSNIQQLRQKSKQFHSNYSKKNTVYPFENIQEPSANLNINCNFFSFVKNVFCLFLILVLLSANIFFKDQVSLLLSDIQYYISIQQNPEEIKSSLEHILLEVLS